MATAVLIVNYRSYSELGQCLTSLSPHLAPNDEVVVVDYESDARALNEAIGDDRRIIRVPRSDNLGFAAGVNLAAGRTQAPYLLLLNPDSIVDGPVTRVLEAWMRDHTDVGVTGPRVLNADGSVQGSARRFPDISTFVAGRSSWLSARFPNNWLSSRNMPALSTEQPVDVDWLSGACLMTRRDLFEAIGGFDERFFLYWEDADYCYRVAHAGFRRVYLPSISITHVAGRSSAHDVSSAARAFDRSAFRLYWKRASFPGRFLAPAVWLALRIRRWVRG